MSDSVEEVRRLYFDWLSNQICERSVKNVYRKFLLELHSIKFVSLVANDDNRNADGLHLREIFLDEYKIDSPYFLEKEASLLEMLIALAQRMDFILDQNDGRNLTNKWFWLFIKNLKLRVYRSDDFKLNHFKEVNKQIINKFLYREYDRNGNGGIFPLNYAKGDQRTIELWYQMMAYIEELGL